MRTDIDPGNLYRISQFTDRFDLGHGRRWPHRVARDERRSQADREQGLRHPRRRLHPQRRDADIERD